VAFDIFRPAFWGDSRVESWYQQNTFLYVRKDSSAMTAITAKGLLPMKNLKFMDCLHPDLYLHRDQNGISFRGCVKRTVEALKMVMNRRKEHVRREPAGNEDMTDPSNV
jgi:hypothetical protein